MEKINKKLLIETWKSNRWKEWLIIGFKFLVVLWFIIFMAIYYNINSKISRYDRLETAQRKKNIEEKNINIEKSVANLWLIAKINEYSNIDLWDLIPDLTKINDKSNIQKDISNFKTLKKANSDLCEYMKDYVSNWYWDWNFNYMWLKDNLCRLTQSMNKLLDENIDFFQFLGDYNKYFSYDSVQDSVEIDPNIPNSFFEIYHTKYNNCVNELDNFGNEMDRFSNYIDSLEDWSIKDALKSIL